MTSECGNRFCVTYFQTRPLPQQRARRPWQSLDDRLQSGTAVQAARRLCQLGFAQRDMGDFYDVALGDAGLFWRFGATSLSFSNTAWDERGIVIETPIVSVLLTETGHCVLGISLRGQFQAEWLHDSKAGLLFGELALLSQEQRTEDPQAGWWTLDRPFETRREWHGKPPSCSASVRRAFDLFGFALHEALLDRSPAPSDLEAWSSTWQNANSRCHALHASGHEAAVRREQVVNWVWAFTTVTDDYVLAGWSIGLLGRVRAAIERDLHTWDLEHREEQVRRRLDGFQSQFQAEQGRLSTALGLVFGVFAYASVLPVLSFVFAWILDNPSVTDAPLERPWAFLMVNAVLLGLLLPASLWLVRRAGSLRSPRRALGP